MERLDSQDARTCLRRHALGDWGDLPRRDIEENELSLKEGFRLLSAYTDRNSTRFYIITQADRARTTLLLPEVFWKWRTPEELARLRKESGREDLAPCVPFSASVFNLDQVEGVARPGDDVPNRMNDRFSVADRLLDGMPDKPEIIHVATREPSYSPRWDRVTLPHLSQFESAPEYYGTLFHEAVHGTGHRKRLDRFGEVEGDRFAQYSFEELVAEFGATFLCAFAGIESPGTEALQAAYIKGWADAVRKDQRLLVRAASASQRAADYIRGTPTPARRQTDD